jgi:hypothetical protein
MELYSLAFHTRVLRENMAAARGDWETVDRLGVKDGPVSEDDGFTPFNVDAARAGADPASHRVTARGARSPHQPRLVAIWATAVACWFRRLRGVPAGCN